ncbi:MAG: hypothetical protein JWP00_4094 [Chloroflexi bacterium]|jgi:hypothetical protein|nr:hypothetical protein [Chloroflexota bacterium]
MFEQFVSEHWSLVMLIGLTLIVIILLFIGYTNYLIWKSLKEIISRQKDI